MNKWNKIHLALVSLVLTSGIEAQESSEQGRIKVGQFDVIPSLTTSLTYVDNVAYANEDDPKAILAFQCEICPCTSFCVVICFIWLWNTFCAMARSI